MADDVIDVTDGAAGGPGAGPSGPLRIGLIAPPWVPVPPPDYGGTELVVDQLARGFRDAGHDVVLFTTGDATCDVPRRWHHPSSLGTVEVPMGELVHVEAAYEALADRDVVHDHTLVGPLLAGAVRRGLPVATTAHGPFTPELARHFRLAAQVARVIAISRSQAASLPDVDTTVIHHGIDVDAVPVGRGDGGYALFLGRMSHDKGVHLAIDAARAAGLPLRIAAKMWEPDEVMYYRSQVAPRLDADVTYLGAATAADKQALLAGAVVLVNPITWAEPFGLVMVEALAAGTPVVAYPSGSAPEIVDHGVTGYLSRDAGELARHVRAAAELDRGACRQAAATRFSARRMVADHLRVLGALAEGRPAGAGTRLR